MEQQAREYFVRRLNEIAQEKVQARAVALFGESGRPLSLHGVWCLRALPAERLR